jgi:hypothetical protein
VNTFSFIVIEVAVEESYFFGPGFI